MKREPKSERGALLLATLFSRTLTLVPRSFLLNRTETLATQATVSRIGRNGATKPLLCPTVSPDLTDMLWDCPWVSDDGSVVTITLVFASHTPLKTTDSTAFLNYRPQRKWTKLLKLQLNNSSVVLLPCRSQFENCVKILEMFNVH